MQANTNTPLLSQGEWQERVNFAQRIEMDAEPGYGLADEPRVFRDTID